MLRVSPHEVRWTNEDGETEAITAITQHSHLTQNEPSNCDESCYSPLRHHDSKGRSMHWTGILNLIAIAVATAVVVFLSLYEGWHWYFALLVWPVVYIGLPVIIGLVQGVGIRREQNRIMEGILSGDTDIAETQKRGKPLD